MTDEEIKKLANKITDQIVIALMKVKAMEKWFDHVKHTESDYTQDYETLEINEEENAIGDIAKLMTLMHLFEEKEEFEKCAVVKRRIKTVNKILKKYSK